MESAFETPIPVRPGATLLLAQFARWLRGLPTDADLQFNILTSEMDCVE